ncbi:hypothetical protein BGY98DRAFT_1002109 [Russula aff. rugulosa BPL654]|nr:hypothetical protein BGY98DRAFT_1002109 [Russula aff. rugulosa BPL654]
MDDLVKVIHDEDEAKRVKVTAEATQRRGALSKRKSAPFSDNEPGQCFQSLSNQPGQLPASNSPPSPSSNVVFVSSNLPNSPFPTARFQIRSHRHGSLCPQDVAANKLPFILASRIVVTSATDTSDNPPQSVFENTRCLWDTGAQTSFNE